MRDPSLLLSCLSSRGAHSSLFISYIVTGRLCKQRTYPCQAVCFQAAGCRKSPLLLGTVFPNLGSHIFQSIPSSLSHTDRWAESSTQPISHKTPACPASGRQSRRAPATAMNVVLQVLPHPTPETTGQIKTVAELRTKTLPWGGAAGGRGQRAERLALKRLTATLLG